MTNELVSRAKKKALESICKYRVSAIGLNKRGEVICARSNRPRFSHHGGSVHAEMRVMLEGGRALKTILLCRVNAKGDLVGIEPCHTCLEKANELGVKIICL